MNLSEAIIIVILTFLTGAVTKLWVDNVRLAKEVSALSRILGMYAGLKASVRACTVQGCMLRGIVGVTFRHDAEHHDPDAGVDAA